MVRTAMKLSVPWRDAAEGYLDVYGRAGKRLKLIPGLTSTH